MIKNLVEYFEETQEFYLDKVIYKRIESENTMQSYRVNCTDKIEAILQEQQVKIIVERTLALEPREMFDLSVSYGAVLRFKQDKKDEYDWKNINLAEEFQQNGEFVLANLMSRMSLLIAEITASFGQAPIVLPPGIAPMKSKNI